MPRFFVHRDSFFFGAKRAKAGAFVVNFDLRNPFSAGQSYAGMPAGIVFTHSAAVLRVFSVRCYAKITESIVPAVIVDVVNLLRRKRSSHIQPRQTMRSMQHIIYADAPVASVHTATGQFSWCTLASCQSPSKYPSYGVIIDKLLEPFLCKKIGVHGTYNITDAVRRQA